MQVTMAKNGVHLPEAKKNIPPVAPILPKDWLSKHAGPAYKSG